MPKYKKTALITGATSGFGEAIAIIFAEHNWNLIITGRREEKLEKTAAMLATEFEIDVHTLPFDITNRQATKTAIDSIPHRFKNIDLLVNNAGLASGFSNFQDADIDDWEVMIDTNIKGLLYVSWLIIPGMIERKSGHVINIGSTAAKVVYPKGNVYCATKFAVDAITKAMRIDLLEHKIKVTAIHPGAAETEFSIVRFHGDKQKAANVYDGFEPMNARDIAEVAYFTATRPANVVLNDIVMTPLSQANSSYINRE
jgi:3-hydroxy acid dehydrogenase / malonic semialdehyde reductase